MKIEEATCEKVCAQNKNAPSELISSHCESHTRHKLQIFPINFDILFLEMTEANLRAKYRISSYSFLP